MSGLGQPIHYHPYSVMLFLIQRKTYHEIHVPTSKWEHINMVFVVGLHQTQKAYNSIWVIVDMLTKSLHFIPIKSTYSAEDYARIFIDEIVCNNGISLSSISDLDAQFTTRFWRSFQEGLGTKVNLLFIPKQIVKRNLIFKPLSICLGLELLILRVIEIRICI